MAPYGSEKQIPCGNDRKKSKSGFFAFGSE
jgi:hypothetical protein